MGIFVCKRRNEIIAQSFLESIYNHFDNIKDPRVDRGANRSLKELIFIALCATIHGAYSWADVERYGNTKIDSLGKFIRHDNGVPSHNTFGRVFFKLDGIEFYTALQSWVADIVGSLKGETIAFDGKTLRGSFDSASGKSPLHSLSAWACRLRPNLGLTSVNEKLNEIPAIQELINNLDLEEPVVTVDALHCQLVTAKAAVDKNADYILVAKGNQPTLADELNKAIVEAFDQDNPDMRGHRKREVNRSRKEYLEVNVLPCPWNTSGVHELARLAIDRGDLSITWDQRSAERIVGNFFHEPAMQSTRYSNGSANTGDAKTDRTIYRMKLFYRTRVEYVKEPLRKFLGYIAGQP